MKKIIFVLLGMFLLLNGKVFGQDNFILMPKLHAYDGSLSITNNGENLFCGSEYAISRFEKSKNNWEEFYGNMGYYYQNSSLPNDSMHSRIDYFKKIVFANKQLGLALSSYGRIYKTVDGGLTWKLKTVWSSDHEFSSIFILDSIGYAVGYKLDSQMQVAHIGVIYKTIDSGDTWKLLKTLKGVPLKDVIMANHDTIYAVGEEYPSFSFKPFPDGLIVRSSDGGKNWISQPITNEGSWNPYPQKIIKYHDNKIDVLFRAEGDWSYLMTVYFDGQGLGMSRSELFAELLTDAIEKNGTRYVIGYNGTIYKSTQFKVWVKQNSPSNVNLKAITIMGNTCYILGGYDPLLGYCVVLKADNAVSSVTDKELKNDFNDLNLYPNPTSGLVKCNQKSSNPIYLYNSNGSLLRIFKPVALECEINLSSYPAGIYFLNKQKVIKN